eukprot:jgi/Mesvir1/287/Mv13617-RA.1
MGDSQNSVASAIEAQQLRIRDNPYVFSFKAGALQCASLVDIYYDYSPSDFFSQVPREELHKVLKEQKWDPSRKLHAPFCCMYVNTGKHKFVVDTGIGNDILPVGGGNIPARLLSIGVQPEQIDFVAITHCHPDHIGGLTSHDMIQFPNAKLIMWKEEWELWTREGGVDLSGNKQSVYHKQLYQAFSQKKLPPFKDRVLLIENEDEFLPGFRAIRLPGHCAHHIGFEFKSAVAPNLVCIGDLAMHPLHLNKPGWQLFQHDPEKSLARKNEFLSQLGMGSLIHAYHFPFPSVGFVSQNPDDKGSFDYQPLTI